MKQFLVTQIVKQKEQNDEANEEEMAFFDDVCGDFTLHDDADLGK